MDIAKVGAAFGIGGLGDLAKNAEGMAKAIGAGLDTAKESLEEHRETNRLLGVIARELGIIRAAICQKERV